jgi:HIV Tat-specific factor 1
MTTSVYVTNLPRDVASAEIAEYFSKCGMIGEDATGQKRVKLYRDEDGRFKGDALVTYFKPESVPLALQLLDETELPRANGTSGPTIRVELVCSINWEANGRLNSRAMRAEKKIRNQGSQRKSQQTK